MLYYHKTPSNLSVVKSYRPTTQFWVVSYFEQQKCLEMLRLLTVWLLFALSRQSQQAAIRQIVAWDKLLQPGPDCYAGYRSNFASPSIPFPEEI